MKCPPLAAALLPLVLLGLSPSLTQAAADGVTPEQILIGQTLTLQGGKNEYGTAVLAGVQAAIEQTNRNGGVAGRKLVLKVMDDDNKSALAEANARQLVTQDKVFLLFGSIEGGPSTAVMKAEDITIRVDIGLGSGRATVYTCDLTKEYVEINGDYRS